MPEKCVILTEEEFDRLPSRIAALLEAEFGKPESPKVVNDETGEPYDRLRDWLCGTLMMRRDEMFGGEAD